MMDLSANPHHTYGRIVDLMGRLTPEQGRIALAIYHRIAEAGLARPSELAAICGLDEENIARFLENTPGVYRDDAHNIVGFWGLTAAPVSRHRVICRGRTLYAWCAWDTLFLPELLDATLDVHSQCAQTERPIRLEVSPTAIISASSPDMVVSMLIPDEANFTRDVVGSFCHHVHFFDSEAAGRQWSSAREGIGLLSLREAFELGKMKNAHQFGVKA